MRPPFLVLSESADVLFDPSAPYVGKSFKKETALSLRMIHFKIFIKDGITMFSILQKDWCNLEVLERNRLAPRSVFYPFMDKTPNEMGESDRTELLSGTWRFKFLQSALESDAKEIALLPTAENGYTDMTVPCSWQFRGYGKFLYTDEAYPFPIQPPIVPSQNETGVYKKTLLIQDDFERYVLRLEGAESCAEIYVNTQFAGYTQGSRLPSEFDITNYLHVGENALCIVVHMFCDGTYLEDQDMWWLGGLMRDIYLIKQKRAHIDDIQIEADMLKEEKGSLSVHVRSQQADQIELCLLDNDRHVVLSESLEAQSDIHHTFAIPHIVAWNAEEPTLYQAIFSLIQNNQVIEKVQIAVGFRHIEIVNGQLQLNYKRLRMRGVNRHEFSPQNGRTLSYQETKNDLLLMKQYHINAVRTSHYPNAPYFYALCDQLGLYVIDECDLETHGFEIEGVPTQLLRDKKWEKAYVERMERTVKRDYNFPCVVMWSMGNESYYGAHFRTMYNVTKAMDAVRPVHYEGFATPEFADVTSTMYTTIGGLYELDTRPKIRPHILCEFAHAMGNGPGSVQEYVDVCENSRQIQGYFVWEWRNHGVKATLEDGTVYYKNGADMGSDYHSGNFCMDGLLSSDSKKTPGFYAYTKAIEPVKMLEFKEGTVTLQNRFTFKTLLAHLHAILYKEGKEIANETLLLPSIAPYETCTVALPQHLFEHLENTEYTLVLKVQEDNVLFMTEGIVLKEYQAQKYHAKGSLHVEQNASKISVIGEHFSYTISLTDGAIENYIYQNQLIIKKGPMLNFFRAYIDNDAKFKSEWLKKNIHSMTNTLLHADMQKEEKGYLVTLSCVLGANARNWRAPHQVRMHLLLDGSIYMQIKGDFEGDFGTYYRQEVPKIGTNMRLNQAFQHVTYYATGDGETYVDSVRQGIQNVYTSTVRDLSFPYDCPQDCGNRTNTKYALFTNEKGVGIALSSITPKDMSAHMQSAKDIMQASHPFALKDSDCVHVNFDYINSGLGSASCGPNHLNHFRAVTTRFEFDFVLSPLEKMDIQKAHQGLDVIYTIREDEKQ